MQAVQEEDEFAEVQVEQDNDLGDFDGQYQGMNNNMGSDIMQRPPEGMS